MSYTGNSKEAIAQLAGVDVVITNLQNDLTSETNSRIDAVASLRDDLNSEVGSRQAQGTDIYNLIAAREAYLVSADGVLNARISTEKAVLEGKIDDEKNSRRAGDSILNERLNSLETGLTAQVNEMISNNALDVVQSNLISQYAASLSEADSVIYERIAEKSGLIAVNAFRTKFNSYLNDWFGAYTLNINNVAKTAADYQIPAEVSVNQNPNL